jgi:hypothetical protein
MKHKSFIAALGRRFLIGLTILSLLFLSGCATPLGQQYGLVGGLGGAAIGGAAGGVPGAIIGGAAGGVLGGAIGDQQQMQNGRGGQYRGYQRGYDRGGYYQPRCHVVPVYDQYGYHVGNREVCR